ncbi:bifunctional 3-(3-hydroxy-phenyl)propionate/3-hydroxycinnamic acid hydroxylase [Zavarzinia compransoris]|uniref:3-(3-hydroxyphenyl)propionate hydroxylase n=1 Tax=Zavarzinia compransoris TaxID=1264899 RepID=A0A317DWR7_9PROT|nr:bifunctional 3-(3-hydroxy-phenyl)propionate/3-hydroxycinnamic acid hydroxylase [Zavarzinia compransoris]PWR18306.1 3-(3-hydroxyphenyl)propionate hydroxylase [Zavarzinia compransoris]TDP43637.1 3-(3-hydroxy-phenyl)propionate hydroxylase [Zavarzinia compransoris]
MNQKNPQAFAADVVISGLGPTGLTLAHILGKRGHRVIVLEKEPVFYGNARAVYTDDECMRIFQSIGVADEVAAKMMPETPVQFVRKDGSVLGQYRPLKRIFGWPVVNFFYQPYLETQLSELLARYPNVEVRRGRELVDFDQDADGVTVTHQVTRDIRFGETTGDRIERDIDTDAQTLRARYLVGADGGRSPVRTRLGIEMTGRNFPEPWLVVDLKRKPGRDGLRHLPYFNFVVNPRLPVVSCVQPDGFHRFEFMLMPGMTREWMEKPETVRQLLADYVDPDNFEVKRKLVYTFNALIAKEWRRGRVLLAGDAAHMTPQFMGQGASSGIRDAYNLGWKLSGVLDGLYADGILDSYGKERHGHAKAMIDVSVFMKDAVSMTNPLATLLRDAVLRLVRAVPAIRRWTEEGGFKPLPVYARGQYLGLKRRGRHGPEGALAPQPEVRLIGGRRVLLDDILGEGFAVIGFNCDPREGLSAGQRDDLARLGTRFVTLYPYAGRPQGMKDVARSVSADLPEVEDLGGHMADWFRKAGYRARGIAILRPDRFAFGLAPAGQAGGIVGELFRQLGLQPAPARRHAA